MPLYKRHYSPGQRQFITTSTYRPAPLFLSECFRRCFVETLAHLRQAMKFRLVGRVLMPDHFHLLLNPAERDCAHHARHRQLIERADGWRRPLLFGVCVVPKGLISNRRPAHTLHIMPLYERHYSPGQLQFITTSTYRRAPLFVSECFRRCFVETLAHLRQGDEVPARRLGTPARSLPSPA